MKRKQSDNIPFHLLDDDLFVEWIINPTADLDSYWQEKIESDQDLAANIDMLKEIIQKIQIDEPSLMPHQRVDIWNKIKENSIDIESKRKSYPARICIRIASVAAVFALIIGSVWLLTEDNKIAIDYSAIAIDNEQEALNAENVTLILSNKQVIDIKSDTSNVVYDDKGNVNINSEQVDDKKTPSSELNKLIVPYGKTSFLTLSDGTKVWVNSGSKIIYPSVLDKKQREIFVSGEVFLDVAKNEKWPFVIKTNQMNINVLGTSLNVSAYDNELLQTVVLVSGAVSVDNKDRGKTYKMIPNQLLSYNLDSNDIDIKPVDVDNYISWINGYLLLKNETLDKVIIKLCRHYNATSTYNADDLRKIRVSGKLDLKENIGTVLDYIKVSSAVDYEIKNNHITVKLK